MKVTITQKELIEMIQEKIMSDVKVDEVILELDINKYTKDSIFIKKDNWFVGSFISKHIRGEDI